MKTAEYINLMINHRLPCLTWYFADCPLEEVQGIADQFSTAHNGDIITLNRWYTVLHKKNEAYDLIPRNMVEIEEQIELDDEYVISIPCVGEQFDFEN